MKFVNIVLLSRLEIVKDVTKEILRWNLIKRRYYLVLKKISTL